jgi:hypothetical protein
MSDGSSLHMAKRDERFSFGVRLDKPQGQYRFSIGPDPATEDLLEFNFVLRAEENSFWVELYTKSIKLPTRDDLARAVAKELLESFSIHCQSTGDPTPDAATLESISATIANVLSNWERGDGMPPVVNLGEKK